MKKVRIVTDSTCYLPPEILGEYPELSVVPLYVSFGEESFKEGVGLKTEQFFFKLKESRALPTSSQPSVGDFLEVYKPLVEEGSAIISIHISSKLSGTVDSAQQAAQILGGEIEVIDSLFTGMGLGFMVLEALRAERKGATKEEIVSRVMAVRDGITVIFVVDTLEYLHKGGRIGGAQALLGTLLKIKPILFLKEGRIDVLEKVRTQIAARERMISILEEIRKESPGAKMRIAIHEAQAQQEAREVLESLKEKLRPEEIFISSLGPVLATHTGPGLLGFACFLEDEKGIIPSWGSRH
ncbi:MAG: DegV family protein [Caldiserica bacterium]|jgi:DegV family protein with EDD domain|nr:DegV family protein [Caldisericota bacterium]MDH7562144.1 DegV family protein [Caldisericota bacterium]